MALYGHLQEFRPETEDIETYLERVDLYFLANATPDDKQVPIFLNIIGAATYGLLRSLLAPDNPKGKSLADLKKVLEDHFQPKRNVVAERFYFHRRNQKPGETVIEYVAELRRLASRCSFNRGYLEEVLRDRFVCGVHSEATRKKLLSEGDVTFSKAVETAQSLEAVNVHSQALKTTSDLTVGTVRNSRNASASTWQPRASENFADKPCSRCGKAGHAPRACPFKNAVCHKCKKKGHLARACRGGKTKPRGGAMGLCNQVGSPGGAEIDVIKHLHCVGCAASPASRPYKVTMEVEGKPLTMEVDTGAVVSVISEATYNSLFTSTPLTPCSLSLHTFTHQAIKVLGQISVKVRYNEYMGTHMLVVVKGHSPTLLGRNWLEHIRLDWASLKTVSAKQGVDSLLKEYEEVFREEPGVIKGVKATLSLKEGAQPRFHRPRSVPYAIKDKVTKELNRLEETGILRRVDYAEWAAPIVPVPKRDGTFRVCGDYKVTINSALKVDQYPLPTPADLMASLTGGTKFSQLDLSAAYQQMELDSASAKLVTVNTHQGLYEYTRLPFGVASAPAVFQKTMDGILQGIPNTICYLDDILVTGRNEVEHLSNLERVLSRLKERGMRLRRDKCRFMQERVDYLGHTLDAQGIHTSTQKVKAILEAPTPGNVHQLRSFLGLLNYYGKFLPNLATLLHPLHALLKSGQPWVWSHHCEMAFQKAKKTLADAPVLAHYDPQLPIVLAGDASSYGLGAVISHKMPDGSERPVAYASRTLTESEKNYSQIEREALSLVFGIKRFHKYLYGRHFLLHTDHRPLTTIFGPKQGIPPLAAARMQRWALLLSAYTYTVQFRPTAAHANADGLSRLPLKLKAGCERPEDPTAFNLLQIEALPVQAEEVALATQRDPILSKVLYCMRHGWPNKVQDVLLPYWRKREELTSESNCILWGMRVVIPSRLRGKVLDELHQGHQGIGRMKSLARGHIWWPDIDKAIEEITRNCSKCQEHKNLPGKAPLYPWTWPVAPWERVHLDFAGPILGKTILIIVDSHSKWLEIYPMLSTSASKTIVVLREVFARYGLPKNIVSDNGPQFVAEEFQQFMRANGIRHIRTSPYHPASNGAAERVVQTVKKAIRAGHREGELIEATLARFLLQYRNTPHATTGVSPSSLFFGRALRTRLDLLKPDIGSRVHQRQECQKAYHDRHSCVRSFTVGQRVWTRNFREGPRWIMGEVTDILGPLSYLVRVKDGALWRRHVDHLREGSGDLPPQQSDEDAPDIMVGNDQTVSPASAVPSGDNGDANDSVIEHSNCTDNSESSSNTTRKQYPSRDRRPPERLYGTLTSDN